MSNTALIHGPLPETNYLYKNIVVKGNFPLASLLIHPDTKYTIKHNFDLEGQTIELPPNCILAIDGGMIYNGTLIGDDSILIDVNRLGNVLDNVIQTGTWKKQDVLNSLSIGTVISGDEPQVTITGEDGDAILNFVLPKGDKGETGTQGELGIQGLLGIQGEKGDKGTSITSFTKNFEETEDYLGYNVEFDDGSILSVNIPKGPKGDQGILGIQGIQGILGVPGPTGPQGPSGNTVTATDYTIYNVQGSDRDGAMSLDATTKAISAQTGYYTCSTESANPSKRATAESGNLYKLVKGGHFKVYMEFTNTADSYVTLLVGSETAVDLYYNGAAVSSQNTWEANEIISVFYDGTRFMASNSQGGGGKAEKISYDNSQSGLAAENVQDALDKVSEDSFGYEEIPITNLELYTNQWIKNDTLKYTNQNSYSYRVMEVNAGDVVKITGGNVNAIHLAFLNTFNPINNTLADIVQYKGSSIFYLGVNMTKLYVVPENAHYMYILYYINGQARTPSYIGKQYSIIGDLQEKTTELMDNRDAVDIPIHSKTTGAFRGDGTWDSSATTYELCRYKLNGAKHLYVKNELGLYANYAFSTSSSISNIINGTIEICAWDGVLEVPEGATYIFINHRIAGDYPIVRALSDNYAYTLLQAKKNPQFHAVKCMKLPWYRNMAVATSGRYIFATKDNGICKIDAGIESQPEVGSVLAAHDSNFKPWGAAINGDYLYLATRNMGSGDAQSGSSPYGGYLDIIKISTWEVVKTISYPVNMTTIAGGHNCYFGKASGVATYGNYLCVAMNLEGFILYDITDKENPSVIGSVDTKADYATYYSLPSSEKNKYGATEYQTCRFYHDGNGNLRLAMVGYGYNYLEIYNPATTISSRSDALCTVLYSDIPFLHIKSHTKGFAVNYPYVYNTIGAWPSLVTDGNRQVGIIVTDISDLSNHSSRMVLLPANVMTSSYSIEGSPHSMAKCESHIIIDDYGFGYAAFDISDPANPEYVGLFGTPYTSEVEYVEDGRLIGTGACPTAQEPTVQPPITIWRGL